MHITSSVYAYHMCQVGGLCSEGRWGWPSGLHQSQDIVPGISYGGHYCAIIEISCCKVYSQNDWMEFALLFW